MTVDEFIQLNPNWKSKSFKGKFDSIIVLPENIQFKFLKNIDFSKFDKNKIKFQFKDSFLVTEDGIISTKNGLFFTFNDLNNFKIEKPKGFLKVPIYYTNEGKEVDNLINHIDFEGEIFRTFLSYLGGGFDSNLGNSNETIFPNIDKNDSLNNLKSILDPSKNFDNPFEIIRHIKVSYKGSSNYYELDSFRDLIKPKMFRTNIWNSTIREQLIKNEYTPQGKLLPLGNVRSMGTLIKRELLFGIIDGDEGILFFPPTNYSPLKKGFKSELNHPEITILNGKKELLSGKPSPYHWGNLTQNIKFDIFKRNKQINEGNTLITYKKNDNSFVLKYTDRPFRQGRSSYTFDSSYECKLSFNSNLINSILSYIETMFNNGLLKEEERELDKKKKDQKKRSREVDSLKRSLYHKIDKDNNGKVDIFEGENEFETLLRKNQEKIQGSGDNYVQSFIRITNYLNTKRSNINGLYEQIRCYKVDDKSKLEQIKQLKLKTGKSLKECKDIVDKQGQNFDLKDSIGYLENQIHLWNLLFFHSVNMLDSLIRDDKITFYEIYEKFDKLGIFNSNWENEVSEQLKNIEEGIGNLIRRIQQMESNLILELQVMSYMNSKSIDELNHSVTQSLQSVNSSVNFNNLLTGIQTYQLYKINKNTKSLRD